MVDQIEGLPIAISRTWKLLDHANKGMGGWRVGDCAELGSIYYRHNGRFDVSFDQPFLIYSTISHLALKILS